MALVATIRRFPIHDLRVVPSDLEVPIGGKPRGVYIGKKAALREIPRCGFDFNAGGWLDCISPDGDRSSALG